MTGLTGQVLGASERQNNVCAATVVDIAAGEQHYRYTLLCKPVDRSSTLSLVKQQLTQGAFPGLLVTSYLSPELAERCRTLQLCFLDTAGNAYLQAPGLLVFVKGQRPANATLVRAPRHTGTPTALRQVFVLLCWPTLLQAPYRDLVQAAGIALGAVGSVFRDLQRRGYLTLGKSRKQRLLLEPQRLLEEWVTAYPMTLRPRLHPRRFLAPTADWWHHLDVASYGGQWGGEVAADKLTGSLKPETVTIYLRPEQARQHLSRLVAEYRLRAHPQGPIEILTTFWKRAADPHYPDVVPPLLVYADLLATHDPRNLEAAREIDERFLAPAFRRP